MLQFLSRKIRRQLDRSESGRPTFPELVESTVLTGPWLKRLLPSLNPKRGTDRTTVFIIICLSYEMYSPPDGDGRDSMKLNGPVNDLQQILRSANYRFENEDRQFNIFADFQVVLPDDKGAKRVVPTTLPTRDNIALCIQETMKNLSGDDKCLFFFAGHIARHESGASMVFGNSDDDTIKDLELREWFGLSRFPTTTIIAVFDACFSGRFLDLPCTCTLESGKLKRSTYRSKLNSMTSNVIEIASTRRDRRSFSAILPDVAGCNSDHGILTWYLCNYLRAFNPKPTSTELALYLFGKCDQRRSYSEAAHPSATLDDSAVDDEEYHQAPVISSTSDFKGRISLF